MPEFWGYPHRPMITHTVHQFILIGSQVKTRQSQSYKFKEFAKTSNHLILKKKILTHDTPSEVAWQDVWIWNGSGEYCRRYRADIILSTDGQTDGHGETSIPPLNFVERGYQIAIIHISCWLTSVRCTTCHWPLGACRWNSRYGSDLLRKSCETNEKFII